MKKVRVPLIWQISGEHWDKALFCNNMSARGQRVISTDEIQINHKPAEILLTKKGGSQQKWSNPKYNWDLLIVCTR